MSRDKKGGERLSRLSNDNKDECAEKTEEEKFEEILKEGIEAYREALETLMDQ